MARHRWATGEHTSNPDRLDRVLNLKRVKPEAETEPAWPDALTGDDDYPFDEGSGVLIEPDARRAGHPPAERRRPGRRWVATRRAALLAAGCALTVGGWQFISTDRVSTDVVPIEPPASAAAGVPAGVNPSAYPSVPAGEDSAVHSGAGDGGAPAGTVVVHVAGAVQAPGVVEAAVGSRVFEVLEKAGGPLPEAELSAVNLAAVVQDGQQILIPRAGEPVQPLNPAPAPESGSGAALINLNTADATGLEELPRVGPVLAERIVEWRDQHGPFARPEDLDAVPGIGPAMLESLLPLVTV